MPEEGGRGWLQRRRCVPRRKPALVDQPRCTCPPDWSLDGRWAALGTVIILKGIIRRQGRVRVRVKPRCTSGTAFARHAGDPASSRTPLRLIRVPAPWLTVSPPFFGSAPTARLGRPATKFGQLPRSTVAQKGPGSRGLHAMARTGIRFHPMIPSPTRMRST
jgi:hypothetical protein